MVMSPKAQGLVSNTHHEKKMHVEALTHDSMNAGKGAKRTSGSTGKKTTYSDEIIHAVASLLPKEDDSSRWVSTLAPLTFLKSASKHAVTLNENIMLYNVSDAPKAAMVTPPIVNFGLQKGGSKEKEREGVKGVDTLRFRTVCHASLCSFCHQDPRSPTTVVHQHQNTNVNHDIYTRTVIYAPSSPICPVHTLQGSETAAFTQRKWSVVQ